MAASCELEKTNQETTYTFRFSTTDKIIPINEDQLSCFPYLSCLVAHNINFSSIKNKDGEYVLDSRIRYDYFMPIFKAATTGHPSDLFIELPEESLVWEILQLHDYLCVNPIPVPLLKGQDLVRRKSDDIDEKKFHAEYCRVTSLVEIRDIAAQFIIALSKDIYNLDDSDTSNSIFSLIMTILSNPIIFDMGLCHHMLTVIKYSYFPLFSSAQQCQLERAEQSIERLTIRSLVRLCADGKLLLRDFPGAFVWKGKYVIIEDDHNSHGVDRYDKPKKIVTYCRSSLEEIDTKSFDTEIYYPNFNFVQHTPIINQVYSRQEILLSFQETRENTTFYEEQETRENTTLYEECDQCLKRHLMSESDLYNLLPVLRNRPSFIIKNPDNKELDIDQAKQQHKEIESKSAGSDYLDTLPK